MTPSPLHFLDLPDLEYTQLEGILQHAHELKTRKFQPPQLFRGLSLAMIFDKRSTRTRMSFEVAMKQLGGHTVVMDMADMQISGAENAEDTSQVLSRYVDAVMIRMSDHRKLVEMAHYATIPFINGLTDWSHPCQLMADLMTLQEVKGELPALRVAWLGDWNNMARTWAQAAGIWGFELRCGIPPGRRPTEAAFQNTSFLDDAQEAVARADVVVTDTWTSMGQEGRAVDDLHPYQVDTRLMAAAKPDARFMHCMPIHRGEEVTDEVLRSEHSIVYQEAENRLHAQKAVLAWCMAHAGVSLL